MQGGSEMDIDVTRVLGLVTRAVRNFEKDGKPASAVTLTLVLAVV